MKNLLLKQKQAILNANNDMIDSILNKQCEQLRKIHLTQLDTIEYLLINNQPNAAIGLIQRIKNGK